MATDYHATQILLEKAIETQANVRTFRYSTTDLASWYSASYSQAMFTDNTKALAADRELLMQANEIFVVEVGFSAKVKNVQYIRNYNNNFDGVTSSQSTGSDTYPVFAQNWNPGSGTTGINHRSPEH